MNERVLVSFIVQILNRYRVFDACTTGADYDCLDRSKFVKLTAGAIDHKEGWHM